ncbi:MAG: site-specific integrase [Promethearchaeota archaeon]
MFDGLALMNLPSKEHLESYLLSMVRRNFRRLTIQQALGTLKLFLSFLRDTGKDRLEGLNRRDLEAFVEREQDRGLKRSSVKAKLDRVHAFVGFLVEEEVIGPEVLVRKIRLRLPQYLPRAIDPADTRELL